MGEATNNPADGPVGRPPGEPVAVGQERNPPTTPATPDNNTSGRGGRGRGRGGSRSRSRGRGYRGRGSGDRVATPAPQTFFGNTDGMKGNVFQCHGKSNSKQQFLKTVGVLKEHINKMFTYPQDVASVCKSFELSTLTQPPNLTKTEYDEDMGKRMIWQTTMKLYMNI
jgi:hypothetical protein